VGLIREVSQNLAIDVFFSLKGIVIAYLSCADL
jgi:hypothetical protein